ncbi:hypothetical protein ACJ73_09901 [Blastomyces percursus]|uniref:Uncharacterized protein n=1 Tax=Blastomyces percursus TaxID=1658174 RepID=A0A1J9Q1R1_9EURO|nr:hypothetical protein ACJ73_09901 [Blastomyces percursus]
MADNSSPDYEALYGKAEAERRLVEEGEAWEKLRSQPTTLEELIKGCHDSFSRPSQVGAPSRSTKGQTPRLNCKNS